MARGSRKPKGTTVFDPKQFKDEYLSRFLKDQKGDIKGETIDLEEENLIVKNGDDFFRVPIANVELLDDLLVIRKRIDWKKARELGEKWKKRELDPL